MKFNFSIDNANKRKNSTSYSLFDKIGRFF